ncbi:hypothetical protein [Jannaschia sp. 2305UL9-9]|uniref:hypothetical protein n=1 Tax=Jannaschia sp. 2305UL9-9 TaxID=3121638 RepID=UPI00352815B5
MTAFARRSVVCLAGVAIGGAMTAGLLALAAAFGGGEVMPDIIAMALAYVGFRYLTSDGFLAWIGRSGIDVAHRRLWRNAVAVGLLGAVLATLLLRNSAHGVT